MGERQVSSGRKAKSARAQRREAERREAAAVRRLEARARVLTYEPGELDQAVGQQPRLLDVALMSRYAARGRVFSGCRELLPPEGSLVLTLIPAADAVLCKAGAGWSLAPDCWGRPTWPDMLRWGLDKAADTCRLLRVGLTYGAVVTARAQLERWTLNVAFHHKVAAIGDTESAADYVRRVWSVYPEVAESFDVGLAWSELSEWLHGRGLITAALGEIADAAGGTVPGAWWVRREGDIAPSPPPPRAQVHPCLAGDASPGHGCRRRAGALPPVAQSPRLPGRLRRYGQGSAAPSRDLPAVRRRLCYCRHACLRDIAASRSQRNAGTARPGRQPSPDGLQGRAGKARRRVRPGKTGDKALSVHRDQRGRFPNGRMGRRAGGRRAAHRCRGTAVCLVAVARRHRRRHAVRAGRPGADQPCPRSPRQACPGGPGRGHGGCSQPGPLAGGSRMEAAGGPRTGAR